MNIYNQKKLIALLLVITLLTSFLFLWGSIIVYSADKDNIETSSVDSDNNGRGSWLKGILLIAISYIINNFIDKDNSIESLNYRIDNRPLIDERSGPEESTAVKEVMGFYVNWLTPEASSYESLKANWEDIDMVSPFWYTVNPDGNLQNRYGGYQYEVDSFSNNRGIKVLPLINNNQRNNMILVDPKIRKIAVNNIVELVKKYDYAGVNIDFENIPPWTRNGYTSFIRELSNQLRPMNKMITISVFPKIDVPIDLQGAYDYSALGSLVDRIVIMTYDNHWSKGPAGPIAPVKWVEKNIKYALEYIPGNKILLGIANYGYDWAGGGLGKDLSAKKALKLASERGAEIKWSDLYKSPFFYYWDEEGIKHEVWFESSNSLAFKLDMVQKYGLQGIAIWRLGNSTDKFWETIKQKIR